MALIVLFATRRIPIFRGMNARALDIYDDGYRSNDSPAAHQRLDMLIEIDFKWLMAGLGWLVDPERLRTDPMYANDCLRFAAQSGSNPLQACAECLRNELGLWPGTQTRQF
jgi:hypothetical protein